MDKFSAKCKEAFGKGLDTSGDHIGLASYDLSITRKSNEKRKLPALYYLEAVFVLPDNSEVIYNTKTPLASISEKIPWILERYGKVYATHIETAWDYYANQIRSLEVKDNE